MKYHPRNELKHMMANLVGIKERIRDIQYEITIHGQYNETAFTNLQLSTIRDGLEKLIEEVFKIEETRVKVFREYKIPEQEDLK